MKRYATTLNVLFDDEAHTKDCPDIGNFSKLTNCVIEHDGVRKRTLVYVFVQMSVQNNES